MGPNPLVLLIASLIPFFLSAIWYHPSLFGGENWNHLAQIPLEKSKTEIAKWKVFVSLMFNFFLAFGLFSFSVHQFSVLGLVGGNPELLSTGVGKQFMEAFGSNHLSFGHGAVHGTIATFTFIFPILMYNTIFERKSGKYFMVNLSFWLLSCILMAGVICQWGANPL